MSAVSQCYHSDKGEQETHDDHGNRRSGRKDGQRPGGTVKEALPIGTNSIATAAMLKAGADAGATGENPAVVTSRTADIIVGPMGIVIADSLMGEITPKMAVAIGQSLAQKVLIPVNRCQHFVVGCRDISMGEYVKLAVEEVLKIRRGEI